MSRGPHLMPDALRTNGVTYSLFKVSPVLGSDGRGELVSVYQAAQLVDIFQAIPRLGLADKPHVIVVAMTLISPFAPAPGSSPAGALPDRPPESGLS